MLYVFYLPYEFEDSYKILSLYKSSNCMPGTLLSSIHPLLHSTLQEPTRNHDHFFQKDKERQGLEFENLANVIRPVCKFCKLPCSLNLNVIIFNFVRKERGRGKEGRERNVLNIYILHNVSGRRISYLQKS